MQTLLVLYATREGQAKKIAEHVGDIARERGFRAEVRDAWMIVEPFDMGRFAGAVLVASVHGGRHEREIVRFVKTHREQLMRMPAAFLSVSLTEAGAEDPKAAATKRDQSSAAVQRMLQRFFDQTGWHPEHAKPVAGALAYSKYGPIVRQVVKLITKREGGPTDTSRDHEFTDWGSLDQYVGEIVATLPRGP
jgi:menaquinone-dependent protoporphyrinogen oxidase